MIDHTDKKVLLFWEGFPACGLLVKKVLDSGIDVKLLATRPAVPFENLETLLGHPIIWLDTPDDIWNRRTEFSDRNLIVHTGWNHPGWIKFDAFQKKRIGAKVVVVVDNRFRATLRQYVGAIWFRLRLKKLFDAAFVPGRAAKKLMRFLGMDKGAIITGSYGASTLMFQSNIPITQRPKTFLFVGQLIERKGLDVLLEAYLDYRHQGGTWNLHAVGSGPLQNKLQTIAEQEPPLTYESFGQPDRVARLMSQARVLVAPSRHDNWATVLAEAAACGLHIITTKATGASHDIVTPEANGIVLPRPTQKALTKALWKYERMSDLELEAGSQTSLATATRYNEESYYQAFQRILEL